MSRSNRRKPTWTDSPVCAATPGCGPPLRVDPPSPRSPKPNRCNPFRPRPYPVIVTEQRTASRQALVAYRGNRYSVPPELAAAQVVVTRPVGGEFIDIATTAGIVIARHKLLADGLGGTVRDSGHVIALDAAAMAAASSGRGHRRKQRIPPGPAARAAAAKLQQRLTAGGDIGTTIESYTAATDSTVIDLSAYERAAQQRSTLK